MEDKDGNWVRDRLHAGIDLKQKPGTEVIAMTDGKVIRISKNFYGGTDAVEVQSTDGTIIRYTEISVSVEVGDTIEQGDLVGKIKKNNKGGGSMLHLEIYAGTATGPLSQTSNRLKNTTYDYLPVSNTAITYERRRDLVDPSGVMLLKKIK